MANLPRPCAPDSDHAISSGLLLDRKLGFHSTLRALGIIRRVAVTHGAQFTGGEDPVKEAGVDAGDVSTMEG